MTTPNDLPSVGTEPERLALNAALGYVERNTPQLVRDEIRSLAAERDELASRVTKLAKALTEARRWIGDGECSDGLPREYWTGDHTAAVEMVDAALNASKEPK